MKILLIVLDGAADVGERTPYQTAEKPNIDLLSKNGINGMLDFGYKKDADSDIGFLNILGAYSKADSPGRGYIAALGGGIDTCKGNIYIRANFATLDSEGNVIDRRAGRNEKGLDKLASRLDGMEIEGIRFGVHHVLGHRLVLELEGKNLSPDIVPNDSRVKGPLKQILPKTKDAKFTASVLNKFTYRAQTILSRDPINKTREPPANVVLIRSVGIKKETESFFKRYGMKACVVCAHITAKGIARYLGMDLIDVPGTNALPNTNLQAKTKAVLKALKKYDFVWLHINGTDTLSHSRKRGEKAEFIGKADREIGKILKSIDIRETIICITSDHRSASATEFKGYEHLPDPVPFLVSGDGIKPDSIESFDEVSCGRGIHLKGNGLMPFILEKAMI